MEWSMNGEDIFGIFPEKVSRTAPMGFEFALQCFEIGLFSVVLRSPLLLSN